MATRTRTRSAAGNKLADKNMAAINLAASIGARVAAAKGELRGLKDSLALQRTALASLGIVLSSERVTEMMKAWAVTVGGAIGASIRVTANMTPAETGLYRDLMVAVSRECALRVAVESTPIGELSATNWAVWGKDTHKKALKESVRRALRALAPSESTGPQEFDADAAIKTVASRIVKHRKTLNARQVATFCDMLKAEMLEAIKAAKAATV